MNENTASFATTIACLAALLVALVVFAVSGDTTHSGEAFAALAGFVGSSALRAPRAVQAAATIGLAGMVAVATSGCTPASWPVGIAIGQAAVKVTCDGARKLCEHESNEGACRFFHDVCDVVSPSSGGATIAPDPTPTTSE